MKRVQDRSKPSRGFGTAAFGAASSSSLSYLTEPPSFAAISDPNVVVSLKNVLKKDSTTKAKALEDLLSYVQDQPYEKDGGVEEALIEVWVQIYPRISIDNSRRVRELAHNVQFEIMKSARKRMEKRIPDIVGAWLGGLYDRDRIVARAASDGLSSFLTSPEKVAAFWRKCQSQILDFATDAIRETRDTLSDERSTTKEDTDARYFRVVTLSLSLVLSLLQKVETADLDKFRDEYDLFFAEDAVWDAITLPDNQARKTVCQLLFACINRQLSCTDSKRVRQAFVTGGLKTSQLGSALEFIRALTKLTQAHPDIWVSSSTEKKPPLRRLEAFFKKGSQGSPPKFWECLDQLLILIPSQAFGSAETASSLLTSLKSGITNREEPRTNTSLAWKCYLDTARRLLQNLSGDDQTGFAQDNLFPLFEQFLFASSDKAATIPVGPNAISIFVEAYFAIATASEALAGTFAEEWKRYQGILCSKISNSLPEVSKEYKSSQDRIAEDGRRWFALIGQIHAKIEESKESVPELTVEPSEQVIIRCIEILKNRNFKPFGATQIIEYAMSTAPHLFTGENGERLSDFLLSIPGDGLGAVSESKSIRHLLSCVNLSAAIPGTKQNFARIWNVWVSALLGLSPSPPRNSAIASLMSQESGAESARSHAQLQQEASRLIMADVHDLRDSSELLMISLTYNTLSDETSHHLTHELVKILDAAEVQDDGVDAVLGALEVIAKERPALVSDDEDINASLLAKLLSLSEISDSKTSVKAANIKSLLEGGSRDGKVPIVGIIRSNLEQPGSQSLEIDTLVKQARAAIAGGVKLEDVVPNTNTWMQSLTPFLEQPLSPVLPITNALGGTSSLVVSKGSDISRLRSNRDRRGRSVPARMALFTAQMIDSETRLSDLPTELVTEILYLQCLTFQLASDQITTGGQDGLWAAVDSKQAMDEAESLVSASKSFLKDGISATKWWEDSQPSNIQANAKALVELLVEQSRPLNSQGFYSARALSEILQMATEGHGLTSTMEDVIVKPEDLKTKPASIPLVAAFLTGFGESLQASKRVNLFVNKLVSECAALKMSEDEKQTQNVSRILVLLTLCAKVYEGRDLPVANQRIVFAVKQVLAWTEEPERLGPALAAEICRVLAQLLPSMKDVYGSYWEQTLQFCVGALELISKQSSNDALSLIYSSLKLLRVLDTMPDPNDDLQDAIKEFGSKRSKALIELLKLPRENHSQALDFVDGMVCREVDKIPLRDIPELDDIYSSIASESREIQKAAFILLHGALPLQQEQASVDMLLDKIDARLPDELLSLLLDAPTLESYTDEMLAEFPPPIRCYLLSWKLVFDLYSTSSFKVKNDFTENLKTDNYMSPLLDFMFDVLGHSAAHPLNLDKVKLHTEQIIDYDIKLAEGEADERNMQWLLIHIFYLVLKYTPGLFRQWYLDNRSKQTKLAVESWTTKYFSPRIVSDTLDEVQQWADTQEPPAADEQELTVKVSRNAKEVIAGYAIDESQASISIKIPPSYPIEGVTVSGLNRVAVTEKKWQSWIMTTQGVITFSNGNIVDGLQVFKRNIVGAMKGQGECAICYSIISTDKRMPDKKCGTCKNLFHRSCLYRWFQSSNQNTCPLCRNPIDYLGADTQKRRAG